jgi:hypothetical protein
MKKLLKEIRARLVDSWESTLSAVLVLVGLVEWHRGDITTDEFLAFLSGIGVIGGLLFKHKKDDPKA